LCCALCALGTAFTIARTASAYRPFDGTDADVAENGQFELELGPAHYYRAGSEVFLIAPAAVLNFGILPRFELVFDVKDFVAQRHAGPGSRAALLGTDALLKWLVREGALQGKPGPSVALEGGVLTPELGGVSGYGAEFSTIFSQRWPALALHFNEQVGLSREHEFDLFSGLIAEGPQAWPVRPVGELFVERTGGGPLTRSLLFGLIWPAAPNLGLDSGLRVARENAQRVLEVRFGFTWALELFGA
jgi:hypothetical protein